jgi:hypothetical protein
LVTVYAKPTITLLSGSASQTIYLGDNIEPMVYTIPNATDAKISGHPEGVAGVWNANTYTVSGTPSATGTFNYIVTTTSIVCPASTLSGEIYVEKLFASGNTYSFQSRTWSDWCVVRPPNCIEADTWVSSSSQGYYHVNDGILYYNYACWTNNAATICPDPWTTPPNSMGTTSIGTAMQNNGLSIAIYWSTNGAATHNSLTWATSCIIAPNVSCWSNNTDGFNGRCVLK